MADIAEDKAKNRILIVDDEPGNIRVLVNILQPHYNVSAATNSEQALEIAHTQSLDIILLDMAMPDMSGIELCELLKADKRTKEIPVIFVTSVEDVATEERGLEAGAVDYIKKPVSPPIVQARIKIHLQNYLTIQFLNNLLSERTTTLDEAKGRAKSLLVFV